MDSVKLKRVKLKLIEAATSAALETAVAAWIDANGAEQDCVAMQFYVSGSAYVAALWYVE